MVVLVLITSCQVSENLKRGPVAAQTIIKSEATINAYAPPVIFVTTDAKWLKNLLNFLFLFFIFFKFLIRKHNYLIGITNTPI